MRLPWIRRSTYRQLEGEVLALCAHRGTLEADNASLKRRCAEEVANRDRLSAKLESMVEPPETKAERMACPACAAKDQTIALMADVVDFERSRAMTASQPAPNATGAVRVLPTRPEGPEERMWVTDDEEHIMAALQSGALGSDPEEAHERASKMLAAINAQNVEVEVIRT